MYLRERLTIKVGKVYDKVWKRLEGSYTEVKFLKQSPTTRTFDTVATLDKWFFEYSEFRQAFVLQIAYNGDLQEDISDATHVQIDDDVYVIRRGDTLPPKGTDVTWKFFCERFPQRAQMSPLR